MVSNNFGSKMALFIISTVVSLVLLELTCRTLFSQLGYLPLGSESSIPIHALSAKNKLGDFPSYFR